MRQEYKKVKTIMILTTLLVINLSIISERSNSSEILIEKELNHVSNELIVKLKPGTNVKILGNNQNTVLTGNPELDGLNKKYSVYSMEHVFKTEINDENHPLANIYRIKFRSNDNIDSIQKDYKNINQIDYVEPNFKSEKCAIPNDDCYDNNQYCNINQWGLMSTLCPKAWDKEKGDDDVVIAIIDSGVDYNHIDLKNKIWQNDDPIGDSNNDGYPGVEGIDDDGDGLIDFDEYYILFSEDFELWDDYGNCYYLSWNDDEDEMIDEDIVNGMDDDGDGLIDEDPVGDLNNDGWPGVKGIDDDGDGSTDYNDEDIQYILTMISDGGCPIENDDDENGLYDDIRGWNFFSFNNDVDDSTSSSHGTACAGIAAAATNNKIGMAGVAWNSKIMIVKSDEGGDIIFDSDVANCIKYAADNGADIISMSFSIDEESDLINDAIDYAWNKGLVLVGSSGNDNKNKVSYPASHPNVIAVGATNELNKLCGPLDWDENSGSNCGYKLDLVAPGKDILTTVKDDYLELFGGTSAAAPMVAGVAALIKSKYSDKDNVWIKQKLIDSADDLGQSGKDIMYGYGKVNAFKAVGGSIPSSNRAPEKPSIPTGIDYIDEPDLLEAYEFKSISNDPDGDKIYYLFYWGTDESSYWTTSYHRGLYDSGKEGTGYMYYHGAWPETGDFYVKAKAIDIYGAESEWSDPLYIRVGDNKPPFVTIDSPENGLYIFGRQIMPLKKIQFADVISLGDMQMKINAYDEHSGIEFVDVDVDGTKYPATFDEGTGKWNYRLVNYNFIENHDYKAIATDREGLTGESKSIKILSFSLDTNTCGNTPPFLYQNMLGESEGEVLKLYSFSSDVIDVQGDCIYYKFNWGDGLPTIWRGPIFTNKINPDSDIVPTEIVGRHMWLEEGTYTVTLEVKDNKGYHGLYEVSKDIVIANDGELPTAVISGGPFKATPDSPTVTFDFSLSHDNDEYDQLGIPNKIDYIRWDLDGESGWDTLVKKSFSRHKSKTVDYSDIIFQYVNNNPDDSTEESTTNLISNSITTGSTLAIDSPVVITGSNLMEESTSSSGQIVGSTPSTGSSTIGTGSNLMETSTSSSVQLISSNPINVGGGPISDTPSGMIIFVKIEVEDDEGDTDIAYAQVEIVFAKEDDTTTSSNNLIFNSDIQESTNLYMTSNNVPTDIQMTSNSIPANILR